MDYKSLLHRYMVHVSLCEGIDFTDRLNDRTCSDVTFTEEEVAEMLRLSEELIEP